MERQEWFQYRFDNMNKNIFFLIYALFTISVFWFYSIEIPSVNKCFIGTFKANIIQANKHNICKTRANGAIDFCQEKTSQSPATSGKGFNFTKIIPSILDLIFCHKYLDKLRGNFLVLGIFKIVQNQEKWLGDKQLSVIWWQTKRSTFAWNYKIAA